MGYFSRTKKSCISVFYIRTKFQSSPYNNKHFRILGGTIPLTKMSHLGPMGGNALMLRATSAPQFFLRDFTSQITRQEKLQN